MKWRTLNQRPYGAWGIYKHLKKRRVNQMKEYMNRQQVIQNIMQDRVTKRVNVVFFCAVVLPALWLFFVFLLSLGDIK